jgi:hypothetical protein
MLFSAIYTHPIASSIDLEQILPPGSRGDGTCKWEKLGHEPSVLAGGSVPRPLLLPRRGRGQARNQRGGFFGGTMT